MKKYTLAESSKAVNEPLMAYAVPISTQISALIQLSASEIPQTHIPGKTLNILQKETSLSPQAMADVVGVSKSKYYDLLKQKELDNKHVDALADFANLWQKGLNAFDGNQEYLNDWLHTKNENLGGIRPVHLLSSRTGRRELEKSFMRIEHSIYG